jgi:hypothetical protein
VRGFLLRSQAQTVMENDPDVPREHDVGEPTVVVGVAGPAVCGPSTQPRMGQAAPVHLRRATRSTPPSKCSPPLVVVVVAADPAWETVPQLRCPHVPGRP